MRPIAIAADGIIKFTFIPTRFMAVTIFFPFCTFIFFCYLFELQAFGNYFLTGSRGPGDKFFVSRFFMVEINLFKYCSFFLFFADFSQFAEATEVLGAGQNDVHTGELHLEHYRQWNF